jgi:ADP-ribose pyrophosphatase YjhB (NUDIX family)
VASIARVHVDEALLAPIRARYGEPVLLQWEGELTAEEMALVRAGGPGRRHDVTLFIFRDDRLALIRKPAYPPGIWRTPGGGVKEGEDFADGVLREALEETGAVIELERYVLRTEARFRAGGEEEAWQTHVFSARTETAELDPLDTREIEAARWGTAEELFGPIRERILLTGRALWAYRAALHEATLEALAG